MEDFGKKFRTGCSNATVYLISAFIMIALYHLIRSGCSDKKSELEMALKMAADEINKDCPIMVGDDIRFDNAAVVSDRKFMYNYTLLNYEKKLTKKTDKNKVDLSFIADIFFIDEFKANNEESIINMVKTSPTMKAFRDNRITVIYHYSDKNGVFLFQIDVTPELYSN